MAYVRNIFQIKKLFFVVKTHIYLCVRAFVHFNVGAVVLNNNKTMSKELRIEKFLAQLKTEKKASDWQVHQANESLQLYFDHFLKGDTTMIYTHVMRDMANAPKSLLDMLYKGKK